MILFKKYIEVVKYYLTQSDELKSCIYSTDSNFYNLKIMNVHPVQAEMVSLLILSLQTDHPLQQQLNKIKPIS